MNRRSQIAFFVALALALPLLCPPAAAQAAKRLILKDGSYQPARQWEIQGDRVRYLSSERGEWEEIPASLVDWKATENYNKERDLQLSQELKLAQQEDESDAELAAAPMAAPGLQLPSSGGVYLLDRYQGQAQLSELAQQSGGINRRIGKNIMRAAVNPIASAKQSIELKGEHARIQAHSEQPVIYLDLDEPDPASKPLPLAERFRIAKLEVAKNARVVGMLKVGLTGKVTQQQESFIPATVEKVPGDWVKLTPAQPLAPGEYALVEMLGPKEMNMYVWDFGVNRSAPENSGVWRAAPSGQPASTEPAPDLQQR
ncbi:MAG: hypothetical protein ABSD88_12900 [Candidatus Korobacteraceae bacterium]|jgi:hypothetical protein